MLIPCDDCEIKDICSLVGSCKRVANKLDQVLGEVNHEFLEVPIICKRQQKAEDLPFPVGESTDRDMQEVLPVSCIGGGDVQDDDGDLPGVSVGTVGAE